ncbi:MAG: ABC transporter permease [Bacteriovoracia bacterium]
MSLGKPDRAASNSVNTNKTLHSWRWAALVNGFRDATAYRFEFLFEILSSAAVPALIQWLLWYAVFVIGNTSEVAGFTYIDMISYTLVSILFTQIRGGDHDFELQEMIRSGHLSNYLLKPVGIVEFVYIRGVAPKLVISMICLIVGIVVGLFFGLSPIRITGAMFLALLGNIIHYQVGACLATTAFLWEEAYSVLMVKNMVVSLLSGELIPLNIFPQSMQWIWKCTPFYLYVFGPVQFALGRWSYQEYVTQLGIAVIWCLVGWMGIKITWGLGMRKYLSIGG